VNEEEPRWRLAEELVPARSAAAYTQGLMDLGATVCAPVAPACSRCPVSAVCVARRNGGPPSETRVRRSTPLRKARWLLLVHENRVLLERRPPSGVWGGLWAFPEVRGATAKASAARFGCTIANARKLPSFEHAFTHFRLEVHPVLCKVRKVTKRQRRYRWFQVAEAAQAAVPSPVRRLFKDPAPWRGA
jgi:A/G-specific adenine glycosylase